MIFVKCPMFQSPGYPTRSLPLLWKLDINFYSLFLIFLATHWPTKYLPSVVHGFFRSLWWRSEQMSCYNFWKIQVHSLGYLRACYLFQKLIITSIQKNTHPINLMSEVFGVLVYTLMGVLVMGVFSIWAKTKKLSHRPQWHLKVHYLLMIACSHRSCGALFIHFISAFFLRS